jgi:eukaryotic-like serine/threonine-protein kinase
MPVSTTAPLIRRLTPSLAPRYALDRELGRGGMGTVLLARDTVLDRAVAIKVIDPELAATSTLRQRFLEEARTVARLRHPGIVTVFDAGETDGLLWFAMEYIAGESLRERLNRTGRLDASTATSLLRDLAQALHAAHAVGIVHRDVKPENVLIDAATGHAHLTDFGVARALARPSDSNTTAAGFVLGSPRYMSPEQAAGDPSIDGRSDLYALGLVGYEMLAGGPAFDAETPQALLAKQITATPAPLAVRVPDAPRALSSVIEQALAKDPAARWTSGERMAQALAESSATTRPARADGPRGLTRARWPLAAAAVAAVIALGLVARSLRSPIAEPDAPAIREARRSFFVVPFDVQSNDASLEWLREGSVNMLTLTLAQWSDVRVLDYERELDLLRDAKLDTAARIGLADAQSLGRRAGVRTLVMGQLQATRDSLILIARTYDVESGERLAQSQRSGPRTDDPRSLFDAVARDLLGLEGAPTGIVDVARATTSSITAYQNYLLATRLINGWQLPRADSALSRAISADSTFAMAYFRRSQVRGWIDIQQQRALADAEAAVRFADRLVPWQRELVTANRTLVEGNVAIVEGKADSARARWDAAQRVYKALVERDSTLADAWYGLGVTAAPLITDRNFSRDSAARTATISLRALQRAMALDSAYYFAYPTLVSMYQFGLEGSGMLLDGDSLVPIASSGRMWSADRRQRSQQQTRQRVGEALNRWIAAAPDASIAYLGLAQNHVMTGMPDSAVLILERAMARPAARTVTMPFTLALARVRTESPRALADLRTAVSSTTPAALRAGSSDDRFFVVGQAMGIAAAFGQPRDIDAIVRLVTATDSLMPYTQLPVGISLNWFAAVMRLAMGSPLTGEVQEAVLRGVSFVDSTTLPFGQVIRAQSSSVPYLLALTTRDERYRDLVLRWIADSSLQLPELDALVLLGRGDTMRARQAAARIPSIDSLSRLPQSLSGLRMIGRAETFAQLGDARRAIATYELVNPARFVPSGGFGDPGYALYARSFLSRARLYEQLGERQNALRAYERFLTWWGDADKQYDAERRVAVSAIARLRDSR